MEGWIEGKLPQHNSIRRTYEPIFHSLTKRQIWRGIEILDENENYIGVFDYADLQQILTEQFVKNGFIYIRGVESFAPAVKSQIKKEKQKR